MGRGVIGVRVTARRLAYRSSTVFGLIAVAAAPMPHPSRGIGGNEIQGTRDAKEAKSGGAVGGLRPAQKALSGSAALAEAGSFVFCRSEERRVGKECRSRWSP